MTANLIERVIGRELRETERVIDVERLDRALARAKDDVDAAIHAEALQAVLSWARVGGVRPLLHVTAGMLEPLDRLTQVGREEAWNELVRCGYQPDRLLEEVEPLPIGRDPAGYLARNLTAISVRIADEHTVAELSDLGHDAVARALLRVPGGRDIASRIVSTALMNGMADTWDQVGGDVVGWEYTAVLDAGLCFRCRPFDGRRYATWAEANVDLPGGGPNPLCLGGGRCRCRLVPLPAHDARHPSQAPSAARALPLSQLLGLPQRSIHGDVLAELDTTLGHIGRLVANVPAAAAEGRVPIRIKNLEGGTEGHYMRRSGEPVEIAVDPAGRHPAFTLAHEVGHFLDHRGIGADRSDMASELSDAQVSDVMRRLDDTPEVRRLRGLLSEPHVTWETPAGPVEVPVEPSFVLYLLRRREMFARAFAQWVAARSEDPTLLAQLDRARVRPYPAQWTETSFAPVAEAFDRMAEEQGWTSS